MSKQDFEVRRQDLANLNDRELHDRFWQLTEKVVSPLVDLARTHTSPSIERSVLMRMGFSSNEAKAIVDKCLDKGLLGKGAGNVVYRLAQRLSKDIRTAGLELAGGKHLDTISGLFSGRGQQT